MPDDGLAGFPCIREITSDDAVAAASLSAELGYPVSAEEMIRRLESRLSRADHAVYVACRDGKVIGWIDLVVAHHLAAEPLAPRSRGWWWHLKSGAGALRVCWWRGRSNGHASMG